MSGILRKISLTRHRIFWEFRGLVNFPRLAGFRKTHLSARGQTFGHDNIFFTFHKIPHLADFNIIIQRNRNNVNKFVKSGLDMQKNEFMSIAFFGKKSRVRETSYSRILLGIVFEFFKM